MPRMTSRGLQCRRRPLSKDDPVTLGVFDALRKILKSGTLPRPDSPVVAHLAYVVNLIQWKVRGGPQREVSDEERAKIIRREGSASSIPNIPSTIERKRAWEEWIQGGIWPAVRQGYAIPSGHKRWSMLDLATVQGEVPVWERRLKELHDERDRRSPASCDKKNGLRCGNAMGRSERRSVRLKSRLPSAIKWHDFAPELRTIFCAEFPGGRMKDAASRFIAAVTPVITGEAEPTWTAVKQFLKDARAHK